MVEKWLPVSGRIGYEVSDQGRIRSYRNAQGHVQQTPRVMTTSVRAHGYFSVKFGRGPMQSVHAVVLETFIGPRPPGAQVRHLDGNPSNNRLSNLKWGTAAENYADRRRHGTHLDGERNGRARLVAEQVRAIRSSHETDAALAALHGVSVPTISKARLGRTWKDVK